MYYEIAHESRGRVRITAGNGRLSASQEVQLSEFLKSLPQINNVTIRRRTGSVTICYKGSRKVLLHELDTFHFVKKDSAAAVVQAVDSGKQITSHYKKEITRRIAREIVLQTLMPVPVRYLVMGARSLKVFWHALESLHTSQQNMALLDGAAMAMSVATGDFTSAGLHGFLLSLCSVLEDWLTASKAISMSEVMALDVNYVWAVSADNKEIQVPADQVHNGDLLVVHEGEMIPFDGIVLDGTGKTRESTFSGNALPVFKEKGSKIYAGTLLDEGELAFRVEEISGETQYDKLAALVDNAQNLKPDYEIRAIASAEQLVPYLFAGSTVTGLLTCNADRMSSFMMVDISYALKLALPLSVLNTRKKADKLRIKVKGGRFMEQMGAADVILFDKTGTITRAEPVLHHIIATGSYTKEKLLQMAACVEEHLPQASAQAIARAAERLQITHDELHTEIDNVVAHGIVTTIDGKRTLIGTYHFVFEDEGTPMTDLASQYLDAHTECGEQHIYMAIDGKLEAIFCLTDQIRKEAHTVIKALRETGFSHIVLLTGDAQASTGEVARHLGLTEYIAEMTPQTKADYVKRLQDEGHIVVMVGDGVNDSLALTNADVGITVGTGSRLAMQIADVILEDSDLTGILKLRQMGCALRQNMRRDYNFIVDSNLLLAAAGALGIIPVSTASTLGTAVTLFSAGRNLL